MNAPRHAERSRLATVGLLLISLLAGGLFTPSAQAANAGTETLPAIPAELQYHRVELPSEDNAVIDWLKAVPLRQPLSEPAKTRVRVAWTPGARPLPPEDWAPVEAWLRANAEALRLIEDSLRRKQAQWPVRGPDEVQPELLLLPELAKARLAQADVFARTGQPAKAVDSLLGTLRLGQLAASGGGALIHYLVGSAIRSLALQGMQRLAGERDVPAAELRRLLDGLPSLDDEPDTYTQTIRVEFTDYIVKAIDPDKFARDWTEAYRKNPNIMALLVPEEMQRAFPIFLTPALVAGHPHAYDHAAAVRRAIPHFQRFLRNARATWKAQESDPDDQAETMHRFLEAAEPVLEPVKGEPLPLSRAAADRIREAYNAFDNPLGRLLEAKPDFIDLSARRVFQARVEHEATRAILALRIHQLQRGALPVRLEELVELKLLPAPPPDGFSGGSLHYDRARKRLWSVGADGEDDGGESPAEGRWQQDDAVWLLSFENP